MELGLHALGAGDAAGTLTVEDNLFGAPFNEALVHQVVTAYLNAGRAGTKKHKTRAQVRGGGAKPWRQKGLGRARAGSSSSPIWRGGGATFAAVPRDYSQKVNKKMYRGALRAIISELVREERLLVVEAFSVTEPKTKQLLNQISSIETSSLLIVTEDVNENLLLASRNLHWVGVCDVAAVNPVDLVRFDKIVITSAAIKNLEGRLK